MKSLGNFPDTYRAEIGAQPDALRRAGAAVVDQVGRLDALRRAMPSLRTIVLTGMGSSYDACHVPVTLLAEAGTPAVMVDAAELLHFRIPMLDERTLLVAISQSGESAEVVRAVQSLARARARPTVVSVTNGVDNALSGTADLAFDTAVGQELGPSTMTFAGSLVVLSALTRVLQGMAAVEAAARTRDGAAEAADALERGLADSDTLAARLLDWLGARPMLALLGRGTARAASEMGALLLKEAARFPAEALEAGQFRHGPLELSGPELAVAVVATEEATRDLDLRLAGQLANDGAATLVIGPGGEPADRRRQFVEVPPLDRSLVAAAAIAPIQLLSWALAVRRGREPGVLTIASKVTTDE